MKTLLAIIALILIANVADASTSYTATVGLESRHYILNRGDFPTNDLVGVRADFQFEYDDQNFFRLNLHPLLYVDFLDSDLLRYWPQESFVEFYFPKDRVQLGFVTHFWGSGRFFNPTRVLHRRDLESNFYQPTEMGELSVSYRHSFNDTLLKNTSLELIALPLFQETPLPELDSRFDFKGSAGGIPYSLTDFQDRPDYPAAMGFAAAFNTSIYKSDWQLLYYHGPEHLPGYQLWLDGGGALRLLPFYYTLDMIGLNATTTVGRFTPRLEAALKITSSNDPRPHDVPYEDNQALPKSYFQYVPGIDYDWDPSFGGHMTFSLEYLGDTNRSKTLSTFRPFDNDLFFGVHYDFGNRLQSTLQAGVVKDLSNSEMAVQFEGTTKIYKDLKLKVGGTLVRRSTDSNSPISFFENNSFLSTSLSYTWGAKKNQSATTQSTL